MRRRSGAARLMRLAGFALAAGAMTSAHAEEPTAAAAPAGTVMGPALHVGNVPRALRFYVDGLGMKVSAEIGSPQRRETILSFDGGPSGAVIILLSDATAKSPPVIAQSEGFDRMVLRMADLDATAARLHGAGFAPGEIHAAGAGHRVMLATDPDGYKFELVETLR